LSTESTLAFLPLLLPLPLLLLLLEEHRLLPLLV
jgi:hypothetical protein